MNPENPIVLPDYRNCNLGILSSIVKYYGARIPTKPIAALDAELDRRRSRNTVWFIMDGMGSRILEKNLPTERPIFIKLSSPIAFTTLAKLSRMIFLASGRENDALSDPVKSRSIAQRKAVSNFGAASFFSCSRS